MESNFQIIVWHPPVFPIPEFRLFDLLHTVPMVTRKVSNNYTITIPSWWITLNLLAMNTGSITFPFGN